MRLCPFLMCLFLFGCAMEPNLNIATFGEVADAAGDNRLLLRFVERPLPKPKPGHKAYDFHSLVWEIRDGDIWKERLVLSRADFERGARRRWISALHSLDPATGIAILKVGENQLPDARGSVHVEYSWREWDLVNNRQVRVLRVCADPFEPFEGKVHDG